MKRQSIIAALVVMLGGGLLFAASTHAESQFVSKDTGEIVLEKTDTHEGAYYATGQDITINGIVNGDLYCAGQNVTINGTVNGDVLCAAQTMKITGTVSQDVRLAGQFITLAGNVGGTMTSFAQTVEIQSNSSVGGDINGVAQRFTIDGTVKRDLAIGSEKLVINSGVVQGSARVNATTLTLTSRPSVRGNLEYNSDQKHDIPTSAVDGQVKYDKNMTQQSDGTNASAALVGYYLFAALAMLVLSLGIALLAPRFLERSNHVFRDNIGQNVLVGVAVSLGGPVLAVVLTTTLIGLPAALLIFASLFILSVVSFPVAAYYLSRALFGQVVHNILLLMLTGAVLVAILMAIPILNILVYLIVVIVGMGAVVSTVLKGYRKPRYSIIETASQKKK